MTKQLVAKGWNCIWKTIAIGALVYLYYEPLRSMECVSSYLHQNFGAQVPNILSNFPSAISFIALVRVSLVTLTIIFLTMYCMDHLQKLASVAVVYSCIFYVYVSQTVVFKDQMTLAQQKEYANYCLTFLFAVLLFVSFFGKKQEGMEIVRENVTSLMNRRQIFIEFYEKHNPSMVDKVDALLERYAGTEDLLLTRLRRKYEDLKPQGDDEEEEEIDETIDEAIDEGDDEGDEEGNEEEEDDEEEDEMDEKAFSTPVKKRAPASKSATHSSSKKISTAIEEARAAQEARIQARINRMKKN